MTKFKAKLVCNSRLYIISLKTFERLEDISELSMNVTS